ncbi:alcohol dehydrogenase [Actinomycetes bacterium]|nr:alcohol dehydrogenase [Actinomycetes bacterium]
MKAVVTTGNGGFDKLQYCEVPLPELGAGEILIKVLAAGVNNTEINTRLGWYSGGGWHIPTPFPFIQGTDCCGIVTQTFDSDDAGFVGKRVLVRPCMRPNGFDSMLNIWMGSDFDGAFAQYVKVPANEVFPIESSWTDAELGSIPCSYGSAENMVQRSRVTSGEHVLVAGASGGVGSAVVQLAKIRGATVTAIVGKSKMEEVIRIGADFVVDRDSDLVNELGEESFDVVIDNVGGPHFAGELNTLKRGGRYATSGAIGGPLVDLDLRTMYLKDLTLIGCTAWDEPVFPRLVSYIESNRIKPLVAKTFPLADIARAQQEFLEKKHVGKFVLIPQHEE